MNTPESEQSKQLKKLFIKNKNGASDIFIDTGVYTKNRQFRLYLSSKMNDNRPLVPVGTFETNSVVGTFDFFLDTLVGYVEYVAGMKILKNVGGTEIVTKPKGITNKKVFVL